MDENAPPQGNPPTDRNRHRGQNSRHAHHKNKRYDRRQSRDHSENVTSGRQSSDPGVVGYLFRSLVSSCQLGRRDTLEGLFFAAQLALVVVASFAVSDYFLLHPDRQQDLIKCYEIRFTVVVLCALFVIFGKHFSLARNREQSSEGARGIKIRVACGFLLLQVIALGTSAIAAIIGGDSSNYFAGVIMVFGGIAALVPLRASVFALMMLLMIAGYAGAVYAVEHRFSLPLISNVSMMAGGAAVSWFGCHTMELMRAQKTKGENATVATTRTLLKNFIDLGFVIGSILLPVATGIWKQGQLFSFGNDEKVAIRAVTEIGEAADDACIEFRNTTRFSLILEGAQIYTLRQPDLLKTVTFKGEGKKTILPNQKFRVYLSQQSNYTMSLSEKELITFSKIGPSDIFLIGYRAQIPPKSKQ